MKRYDSYKDSGIEWIGEIPSHWEIATVGRLCILGRGRVISAIEIAENEGVYPVYSSQTENYGIMGKINTFDFEGEYVTWTTDGANAGTVFYREGKFNCTNVCGTIQPKNWKQIDLKFLPYYLNLGTKFSVRLDINPKLMNNMMAKIPIVIPPSTEQTSIANFLDRKTTEIDGIIADKKRLLELYEEEKTAIINQAVTKGLDPNVPMKDSGIEWLGEIPEHWEVKKLKYFARINPTKNQTFKDFEDEIVFLPMEKVKEDGRYEDDLTKPVNELWNGYTYFEKGDILIAKITPCFENGKGALLSNLKTNFGFGSTEFHVIRVNSANPNFVFYVTRSHAFMKTGGALMTGAAGQKRVPTDFISEFALAIPSKDEQQSIVHHIESECSKIDFKKTCTEELIELLTEYRTSLISEVVTGKIKVIENCENNKGASQYHQDQ